MRSRICMLVGTTLLAACSATSHKHTDRTVLQLGSTTPLPPSQDLWYTAPANFEESAPGTILRIRSAPGNLTTAVANTSAVYSILYRTTDSRYQPSWAVTTLFVPRRPASSRNSSAGATALLSYQVAYDSASVDASPSYAVYGYPTSTGRQLGEIEQALSSGWYVNMPDYEGPLASCTAGVQSGHATLDSVRAVLSSDLGLADSRDVRSAMWGYSGGALASNWAAELQVEYAPELKFSGAAMGGPPADLMAVYETCSGTTCAGLIPPSIVGLISQFPDVEEYVVSQLKTSGLHNATEFYAVKNLTVTESTLRYLYQDIWDYFVDGIAVLEEPLVKAVFDSDGKMGSHGTPQMPLFVYQAIADEVCPSSETDALVDKYCDDGATIQYERNTIGGHVATPINFAAPVYGFLSALLGATYVAPAGCSVTNTSYNTSTSPLKRRSLLSPVSRAAFGPQYVKTVHKYKVQLIPPRR